MPSPQDHDLDPDHNGHDDVTDHSKEPAQEDSKLRSGSVQASPDK